jgi:DtxR family Mn-dependent transcriptional regulator
MAQAAVWRRRVNETGATQGEGRRKNECEAAVIHDPREEILERVFALREEGGATVAALVALLADFDVRADLAGLVASGHVAQVGDELLLTERGDEIARTVVRRNRLAERLLADLFDLRGEVMEQGACAFEHALSAEVTKSVCAFLGHPPLCPHQKPIPKGECCAASAREIRPLVTPLPDLDIGHTGRIVFIAPRFVDRLNRLSALGVIAGSTVRLRQRRPACVIEFGETSLALDPEIAREIFVRRIDGTG